MTSKTMKPAHKARMMERRERQLARTVTIPSPYPHANLSSRHPDAALTPAEHERAKAARAAKGEAE